MDEGQPPARGAMRPWMWRAAAILFAVYIFGLIAAYMVLASRTVNHSYTVVGQRAVAAGEPTALRIGVYDIFQGRFLPGARVEVALNDGPTLYKGQATPAGFADVNLQLPADAAPQADARWRITLENLGQEPVTVDVPVTIEAAPQPDALAALFEGALEVRAEPADPKRAAASLVAREGSGPLRLELVAEGGAASDGLRSALFVVATERESGAPQAVEVKLELVQGMVDGVAPASVQTDRTGLGAFAIVPIGAQKWRLTAETRDPDGTTHTSERELVLSSVSTQYHAAPRSPRWAQGERLTVAVRSLHEDGLLFGDVYADGRWVHTEATGLGPQGGGFELREVPGLRPATGVRVIRLQAYGSPLAPGEALAGRWIAVPAQGVEDGAVLEALLKAAITAEVRPKLAAALLAAPWWAELTPREQSSLLAFWLSLAPAEAYAPTLLLDTQGDARGQLADEKEGWRGPVSWLLGISGALALLIVLYRVLANLAKVRADSHAMHAELDDDDGAPAPSFARWDALFQIVIIVGTLSLFLAALVVLLRHL